MVDLGQKTDSLYLETVPSADGDTMSAGDYQRSGTCIECCLHETVNEPNEHEIFIFVACEKYLTVRVVGQFQEERYIQRNADIDIFLKCTDFSANQFTQLKRIRWNELGLRLLDSFGRRHLCSARLDMM